MYALIEHAMMALYPRTDDLPGIEDTDPRAFLRRYRDEATFLMWLGLCASTLAFVLSPVLTVHWPLPSFLLPESRLDRHAARITTSRFYLLRQSVFLIKLAAGLCWGAHPAVRERFAMRPYDADPGSYRA